MRKKVAAPASTRCRSIIVMGTMLWDVQLTVATTNEIPLDEHLRYSASIGQRPQRVHHFLALNCKGKQHSFVAAITKFTMTGF